MHVFWNLLVIDMVGTKIISISAKYFGACFELLTKGGWIMPLSQVRGDLEIQRFLGIKKKKKQVSSVSSKDLFNFQGDMITFYFRHSTKRKPRNTTPLPVYF